MKKIGWVLIIAGIIGGVFAFDMRTVTQEEANQNLANGLYDAFSGTHHDKIYNPELENEKTRYLITAGIVVIIGVILIARPAAKS